jgi:hypothetical protein
MNPAVEFMVTRGLHRTTDDDHRRRSPTMASRHRSPSALRTLPDPVCPGRPRQVGVERR